MLLWRTHHRLAEGVLLFIVFHFKRLVVSRGLFFWFTQSSVLALINIIVSYKFSSKYWHCGQICVYILCVKVKCSGSIIPVLVLRAVPNEHTHKKKSGVMTIKKRELDICTNRAVFVRGIYTYLLSLHRLDIFHIMNNIDVRIPDQKNFVCFSFLTCTSSSEFQDAGIVTLCSLES